MDLNSDSFISSSKSTNSKVIDKLHSMSWLKHNLSNLQKEQISQGENVDGKSFRAKKTDEDYFPGTRDEKKGKKIKKKKDKVIFNFNDLDNASAGKVLSDSKEESEHSQSVYEKKRGGFKTPFNLPTAINPPIDNVWSANTRVADVLFPNVQSVRIDRMEEEEMLSRALAESIATLQLEQFKKKESPKKENSWDALYGDTDDDGGWDNVRRNLPAETERIIPQEMSCDTHRIKLCDDNNNPTKSGILRNKDSTRRSNLSSENLDFCFKKSSDNCDEKIERFQPTKSVAFGETVTVVISCDKPSKDENKSKEVSKREPAIDKYGRVNGFSERRLFMGKGARMKEQLYIKNRFSLNATDVRYKTSESNTESLHDKRTIEEKRTTRDVQTTPTTIRKNIEDTVEVVNKSVLVSCSEKPILEQHSLDQNSALDDSVKTFISDSSIEKFDKETSESTEEAIESKILESRQTENEEGSLKSNFNSSNLEAKEVEASNCREENFDKANSEAKITSTFHETNDKPQDENVDTDHFYTLNIDKKIQNQESTVENSGSVCDAHESEFTYEEPDSTAQRSMLAEVKQEEYVSEFPSENVQHANAAPVISKMVFPYPTYQNLYSTGLSYQDQYLGGQNIAAKNINLEYYHNLNNHSKWQYHQNISMHESAPNYNFNPCFTPGYLSSPNRIQIPHTDHPYPVNHTTLRYLPCRSDVHSANANCSVSSCEETRGIRSSPAIDYTELSPAHVNAENERNRFMAIQPAPGFIKGSQLPPGFARKEIGQKNYPGNCRSTIPPGITQKVMNNVSRNENMRNRNSVPEIKDPAEHKFTETIPRHFEKRIPRDFYNEDWNSTENCQAVNPGPEAFKTGRKNYWKVGVNRKLSFNQNFKPRGNYANDRSTPADNTGMSMIGKSSNDNCFVRSNQSAAMPGSRPLTVCNTPLQSAESISPYSTPTPTHYHLHEQHPPGLCGIPKWQFNVNAMNSTQLNTSLMPGYSSPMSNHSENANSFEIPGYRNYNMNQTAMGRFAPNLLDLTHNRFNERAVGIFSDVETSRGRGRLTKRDLM